MICKSDQNHSIKSDLNQNHTRMYVNHISHWPKLYRSVSNSQHAISFQVGLQQQLPFKWHIRWSVASSSLNLAASAEESFNWCWRRECCIVLYKSGLYSWVFVQHRQWPIRMWQVGCNLHLIFVLLAGISRVLVKSIIISITSSMASRRHCCKHKVLDNIRYFYLPWALSIKRLTSLLCHYNSQHFVQIFLCICNIHEKN